MVISIINGGFANQLYRYACAYATAKRYRQDLILVVQTADAATDPFQLSEFHISYTQMYVTKSYIEVYGLFRNWKAKWNLKEIHEYEYASICEENGRIFQQYDGIILYGAYQNQIFFQTYISDLRHIFQFRTPNLFLKMFQKEIYGKQSVAIHVRRGDFLTYGNLSFGMDFYKAAMCVMESVLGYGQAEYYIFSDDKEFIVSYFGSDSRIHCVSAFGDYKEGIEEFLAISMCSHRILTEGSSFSRMADALNDNPAGYAVYMLNGFENMVYQRENLIYMDERSIQDFVPYYPSLFRNRQAEMKPDQAKILQSDLPDLLRLCKDIRYIGTENETVFRIKKIELLLKEENYADALGQTRKLWELAEGTIYEQTMHCLFHESLYRCGLREESMVEAQFLDHAEALLKKYYSMDELEMIKKMRDADKRAKIVFVPSRKFNPHIFEDMINAGTILKRIGYDVTFMVRELDAGMLYEEPYNKMLYEDEYYKDVMGHDTKCRLMNLEQKEKQYGSLGAFLSSYFAEADKIFLFARQSSVFKEAQNCGIMKKITTVYWDYSRIYDAGNYENVDVETCSMPLVTQEEMDACYLSADYIITHSAFVQKDKPVVFFKDNGEDFLYADQRERIADFYHLDSLLFKNVYAVLKRIIFYTDER